MDDVNKQLNDEILFLCLNLYGYGPLKFYQQGFLHLPKYVGSNNRYKDYRNPN